MTTGLHHLRPASEPPRRGPAFARLRARRRRQIIKHIQRSTAEKPDLISTLVQSPLWLQKGLAERRRGAQPGNTNALTTGRHTAEVRAMKAAVWAYRCGCRTLLDEVAVFRPLPGVRWRPIEKPVPKSRVLDAIAFFKRTCDLAAVPRAPGEMRRITPRRHRLE